MDGKDKKIHLITSKKNYSLYYVAEKNIKIIKSSNLKGIKYM